MSPKSQWMAIATAVGWKNVKWIGGEDCPDQFTGAYADNPKSPPHACPRIRVPDYLGDLNECAQFERTLKDNHTSQDFEKARYIGHLENLVARRAAECGWSFALVTASAGEKCEAFLKAKFLWKDERVQRGK